MSSLTGIVFPGDTEIRVAQALVAIPAIIQEIRAENGSLIGASIRGLIVAVLTGWTMVIVRPFLLPGGRRVRRVQATILTVSILYEFSQNEVSMLSYSRGLWNGFVLSVVGAHVSGFVFFGTDVKDTVQYLTSGQALVDTPKRINSAIETGGKLKSDAENVSRRAKGSLPV